MQPPISSSIPFQPLCGPPSSLALPKIFLLISTLLEEQVNKTMTKVGKNSGVIIFNQKTLRGHSTEMEDLQNRVRQLESGQQDLRRRVSRRYALI